MVIQTGCCRFFQSVMYSCNNLVVKFIHKCYAITCKVTLLPYLSYIDIYMKLVSLQAKLKNLYINGIYLNFGTILENSLSFMGELGETRAKRA